MRRKSSRRSLGWNVLAALLVIALLGILAVGTGVVKLGLGYGAERRGVRNAPGASAANASLAMSHVRNIVGRIGARPAGTAAEEAAADYVADVLREYGYDARRVEFVRTVGDTSVASEYVVAAPPNMSRRPRTVLITASLDTVSPYSVGANSDASGIAAMLECARLLAGFQGKNNVAFVAYGATGAGRFGSKSMIERPTGLPFAPKSIALVVNMESVGTRAGVQLVPWGGPKALAPSTFSHLLDTIAASTGRRPEYDPSAALLPEVRADHSPFLVAGVPALTITTSSPLTYRGTASLEPYWDTVDTIDGASIAKAADAAVAAAMWTMGEGRPPEPVRPYAAFELCGHTLVAPYTACIVVAGLALAVGLGACAASGNAIDDEATRTRSAGRVGPAKALGTALAIYVIVAVLLWTCFIPSGLVGVVRALVRPWTARPAAHVVAGALSGLFFISLTLSIMGVTLRAGLRVPLLRVSLVLQAAMVGFALAVSRVGALFPAAGLLVSGLAIVAPEGPMRMAFAWLAPAPMVWLCVKAALGAGRAVCADLLGAPIVLCLTVAALIVPYLLQLLAFSSGAGTSSISGRVFDDLSSSMASGASVRDYTPFASREAVGGGRRRRVDARRLLLAVFGLMAAAATSALFLLPSYNSQAPQRILVTEVSDSVGGAALEFRSDDNIRGATVTSAHGAVASDTIDARAAEYSMPWRFNAPSVSLDASMADSVLNAQLTAGEPVRHAYFEIVGPPDMGVAECWSGYTITSTSTESRVGIMTAGGVGGHSISCTLSLPSGGAVIVEASGSFERNSGDIILSGAGKRFYVTNRFITSKAVTTY